MPVKSSGKVVILLPPPGPVPIISKETIFPPILLSIFVRMLVGSMFQRAFSAGCSFRKSFQGVPSAVGLRAIHLFLFRWLLQLLFDSDSAISGDIQR